MFKIVENKYAEVHIKDVELLLSQGWQLISSGQTDLLYYSHLFKEREC